MDLTDLTPNEAFFCGVKATSKKQLLQELSHRLAPIAEIDARELLSALLERERLGSTSAGRGVAIPHCQLPNAQKIVGCLARLDTPVDFEAIDGEPVDLIFILLVPPEENSAHLELLSDLARLYGSDENRATLRRADTDDELYETFTGLMSSRAA